MYIYGAMRIGWGAPGEFFYPHLEDRPASPFDLSPLPISVCTFHLGFSLEHTYGRSAVLAGVPTPVLQPH